MPSACVPRELVGRVFTVAQARAVGVSASALRGPTWRQVFRNVYVQADVPGRFELRLAAIRLLLPERAFICGPTSAWVDGIEVQDRRSELLWIGVPTGAPLRPRAGCITREITVEPSDLDIVEGTALTNPLRTAFDCARWLSLVEAVVVADHLAHAGKINKELLAAYAAQHRGLRGVRQVDRVVELMDARSESPMETRVRLAMVFDGLEPEPQFIVLDQREDFVARADFAFEDEKVIVEYDGAFHWDQRREDDRRRDAMRDLGWVVLVFSSADYYQHRGQMLATIKANLQARRVTA